MEEKDIKLHNEFVENGAKAKEWMKKCALLLPEIDRRRIWEKKGFSNIYEYAGKLAGMSRYQINESLRVMRKVEEFPELRKVVLKKGINAIKPALSIVNSENQTFWAEKAQEMTKNNLEIYVREFKNLGLPRKSETSKNALLTMDLQLKNIKKLEKLKGDGSWDELISELIELKVKSLEKPEKVESRSAYIPAAIKKYVIQKFQGLCAFPGCIKPYADLHHTYRFALTNVHDPDQIVPLCKEHHALAHHGLIENESQMPEKWLVRQFADRDHPKFEVDQYVQRCRSG